MTLSASSFFRFFSVGQSKSAETIPDTAFNFFRSPIIQKLVSENVLRSAIPILIMIFVGILLVARGGEILKRYDAAFTESQNSLRLTGGMVSASLSTLGTTEISILGKHLPQLLRNSQMPKGRYILIADGAGRVEATYPATKLLEGKSLSAISPATGILQTFGQEAGIVDLTLPNGKEAFAVASPIANTDNLAIILQTHESILQTWSQASRIEIILVSLTAILLIFITYAYFAQCEVSTRTRAAYETTLEKTDKALSNGHCAILQWDLKRGLIHWTPSMSRLLGFGGQEATISISEFDELSHDGDIDFYELGDKLTRFPRSNLKHEFRMRHKDGTWRWLRICAELVYDHSVNDPAEMVVGTITDISAQRFFADKTAKNDQRLLEAIEAVSDAFVLWDNDRKLVLCNSAYRALHKLNAQDTIPGLTADEIKAKANLTPRQTLIGLPIHTQANSQILEMNDGRWLQVDERPIASGGYVSVGKDITFHKKSEDLHNEQEHKLEGIINDLLRSRQETEAANQHLTYLAGQHKNAQHNAEEASRAKSAFLATMSHELRTPLNAIIGFSEIMQSEALGPLGTSQYREYCNDIHASGSNLLQVINSILDMAKIESGQIQTDFTDVDIDSLIEKVKCSTLPNAEENKIAISHVGVGSPIANVDRKAIQKVLSNILSNAIKFSHPGGKIDIIRRQLPDGITQIKVIDQGIGIPEEAIDHIGRPFVQISEYLTRSHQGSGLGLAIAKSLIDLHQGQIKISSSLGEGTEVTISLPASQENPIAEPAALTG